MNIHITYDTGTSTSGNAMFDAAVSKVTAVIDEMFASNVTINLQFGWGTVNNQAVSAGALGQSTSGFIYPVSYSAFQAAATTAGYTVPVTSPFGATPLYTGSAELKALGLAAASSAIDGYIGLSTLVGKAYSWLASDATTISNTQIDIMGTLFHEITEVMGRVSNEGSGTTPYYTPMDLFRYTGTPGVGNAHTLATSGSTNATNAYFSTDGGVTNYGNWNNDSTFGDYGDWIGNSGPGGVYDPNNDNGTLGVFTDIPSSDVRLMKALGWQSYVADFSVTDLTTNAAAFYPLVQPYRGPNASLLFQFVNTTSTDSFTVKANLANEFVQLGNGNDTIDFSGVGGTNVGIAGNGNNTFIGGSGNNTFTGGTGSNTFTGGTGTETMNGGSGTNVFNGGSGATVMHGGSGTNIFNYGTGTTTITGTGANNTFVGNAQSFFDETMVGGGSGVNVFESGYGSDTMTGSGTRNTYIFSSTSPGFEKTDTIANFNAASGTDTLRIVGEIIGNISISSPSANNVKVQYLLTGSNSLFSNYVMVQNFGSNLVYVYDYTSLANALSGNKAGGFVLISSVMNAAAYTFTTETQQFDANGNLQVFTINNKDGTQVVSTYDTASLQTWTTKIDTYSATTPAPGHALTAEEFDNRDGTKQITTYNYAASPAWSSIVDIYASNGVLNSENQINQDGSHQVTYHDYLSNQPWTTIVDAYSTAGKFTSETLVNDDGTHQVTYADYLNNQPWTTVVDLYSISGKFQNETLNNDDGSRQVTYADYLNNQPWTSVVDLYNTAGKFTSETLNNDDGTRQVTYADYLNNQPWTSIVDVYSTSGKFQNETLNNDDGTHQVTYADYLGNQTWASIVDVYSTGGKLATETVNNHDGSHQVTYSDYVGNQAWLSIADSYNAAGKITYENTILHNGTRNYTAYDPTGNLAWTQDVYNYNAANTLIHHYQILHDGSVLILL